jgi:hypothetical protein
MTHRSGLGWEPKVDDPVTATYGRYAGRPATFAGWRWVQSGQLRVYPVIRVVIRGKPRMVAVTHIEPAPSAQP